MTVHTVRLPATQLHGGTSRNLSPSYRNPNAVIRLSFRYPKLRRFISVSSSLREGNEHGKENSVKSSGSEEDSGRLTSPSYIVFSLEEGPGVLFKALAVFALRQINLTKIESRPLRKHPPRASGGLKYFDYLFYVDFEASMADEVAQNALRHLEEFATFLRILGSYPVDTTML